MEIPTPGPNRTFVYEGLQGDMVEALDKALQRHGNENQNSLPEPVGAIVFRQADDFMVSILVPRDA